MKPDNTKKNATALVANAAYGAMSPPEYLMEWITTTVSAATNLNPVNASSVLGLLDRVEFEAISDMLVGPNSKPKRGSNELSGLIGTCSQHQITNSEWALKGAQVYHNLNSIKNAIPSEKSAANILRHETRYSFSQKLFSLEDGS